ncbi:hypothetical protein EF913_28370 [Streptomyces sp. WAC04189]|uniref:hypothetical protein n=1 Tax=Streptomyces sp. WAC04189 TaxID=2487411 RepID=UPI000FC37197|nr:hypothetical protein [Streptomyces sp. WAC04189]RSR98048.1 hypothetical protein EF913_28370 [Streptomyces sp. WAC04189]
MQHTTWAVTVRMEKDGRYAEYDDTMSLTGDDGSLPTEADVIGHARDLIINASPEMKAGEIVHSSARRIG